MASASAEPVMEIPKVLMDAVNAARPVCTFFRRTGKCKKGSKCKLYHNRWQESHLLPSVSRYDTKNGPRIQIRAPLPAMITQFFKERGVESPIGPSKKVKNTQVIEFQLDKSRMKKPEADVCIRAVGTVCDGPRSQRKGTNDDWCE